MQNKVVVTGKVKKDKNNQKKHKIKKDKISESDITIELTGDGEYEFEKLSVDGLPDLMPDGTPIRWLNNFHIKKNGKNIKEQYWVTIPKLEKTSRLVILGSEGNPYYYTGAIINNTFELTDGDPAVGKSP
jgi:hypothetical protein